MTSGTPLSSTTAVLLAAAGVLVLTIMDAIAKHLAADFITAQITAGRFASAALWLTLVVAVLRPGWPRRETLPGHLVRSLLLVVTSLCFFYAIGRLPLAEVFAITFTGPIFIALFGALLIGERVTLPVWIAIGIGFVGVGVIVATGDLGAGRHDDLGAWAAAIASPVTYALSIVLLRKQAQSEPQTLIVLVQSVMVALLAAPLAAYDLRIPDATQWLWFALLGLCGAVGYLCFVAALARLPAARFAVVEYTGLIWGALIGWAIFNETPRLALWLGAALILGACWLILSKRQ